MSTGTGVHLLPLPLCGRWRRSTTAQAVGDRLGGNLISSLAGAVTVTNETGEQRKATKSRRWSAGG